MLKRIGEVLTLKEPERKITVFRFGLGMISERWVGKLHFDLKLCVHCFGNHWTGVGRQAELMFRSFGLAHPWVMSLFIFSSRYCFSILV